MFTFIIEYKNQKWSLWPFWRRGSRMDWIQALVRARQSAPPWATVPALILTIVGQLRVEWHSVYSHCLFSGNHFVHLSWKQLAWKCLDAQSPPTTGWWVFSWKASGLSWWPRPSHEHCSLGHLPFRILWVPACSLFSWNIKSWKMSGLKNKKRTESLKGKRKGPGFKMGFKLAAATHLLWVLKPLPFSVNSTC